jgi:hypothetical protein
MYQKVTMQIFGVNSFKVSVKISTEARAVVGSRHTILTGVLDMNIAANSMTAPNPATADHNVGLLGIVNYVCHMAVMHWGVMALGKSGIEANRVVGAFNRKFCPGCTVEGGIHGSFLPGAYGTYFYGGAVRMTSREQLIESAAVGDILLTGRPSFPMHSMVVVEILNKDRVLIRGFNNIGTLGSGLKDCYDNTSCNVADETYWTNHEEALFGRSTLPLFLVKNADFMIKISQYYLNEIYEREVAPKKKWLGFS